jgi:hypothetical protein
MCNVVFHTYLIKFHQNVIYLIKTHYSINLKHYSRHLAHKEGAVSDRFLWYVVRIDEMYIDFGSVDSFYQLQALYVL